MMLQVPQNQWLCPNCSERFYGVDVVQASEVELYSDASEVWDSDSSAGEFIAFIDFCNFVNDLSSI